MNKKFYVKYNKCCCCGRYEKKEFAMQNNSGKIFFRVGDEHYKTKDDWMRLLDISSNEITDNDGNVLSYKTFWYMVEENK